MKLASGPEGAAGDESQLHILLMAARSRLMPMTNQLQRAGYQVRREENLDFMSEGGEVAYWDWAVLDMGLPKEHIKSFCETFRQGNCPGRGLTLFCDDGIDADRRRKLCKRLGAFNSLVYTDPLEVIRGAIESGLAQESTTTDSGENAPAVGALLEHVESHWQADDYTLLGVSRDDAPEAIESAYHLLALNLHPDRHRHLKTQSKAFFDRLNRVFKRVNEVYLRLSDPQSRNLYDLELWIRARSRSGQAKWGVRREVELRMCRTARGRALVSRSLKERFFGQWRDAEESMARAVAIEGDDSELARVLESVRMIRDLTNS